MKKDNFKKLMSQREFEGIEWYSDEEVREKYYTSYSLDPRIKQYVKKHTISLKDPSINNLSLEYHEWILGCLENLSKEEESLILSTSNISRKEELKELIEILRKADS